MEEYGTYRIEGDLQIFQSGEIFVGTRKMKNRDVLHLPVSVLRRIIEDAKEDLI